MLLHNITSDLHALHEFHSVCIIYLIQIMICICSNYMQKLFPK